MRFPIAVSGGAAAPGAGSVAAFSALIAGAAGISTGVVLGAGLIEIGLLAVEHIQDVAV